MSGLFSKDETRSKGCFLCPLHRTRGNVVVSNVNCQSDVLFLGDVPGKSEVEQLRPFVGTPGQLLRREISTVGFGKDGDDIKNISRGNAVQCRPMTSDNVGRDPSPKESSACSDHLHKYIAEASPKVIVALGTGALKSLIGSRSVGIVDLRGRVFWYRDEQIFVVSTYHPLYILRETRNNMYRGRRALTEFREDLQLAYELRSTSFPEYSTIIANRLSLAIKLLQSIKKQSCTSVDVEGRLGSLYIACIAFTSEYGDSSVVIPVDHPESKLWGNHKLHFEVWQLIRDILVDPDIEIFGQNFNGYDRDVLEANFDCEVASFKYDSMYGSYIDDERSRIHSLELVAARHAHMGNYDYCLNEWAEKQGKSRKEILSDCASIPLAILGRYNGLDAIAQHLSWESMLDRFSQKYLRLSRTTTEASRAIHEMFKEGMGFDFKYSQRLSIRYEKDIKDIKSELRRVAGNPLFNPASPEEVGILLFETLKIHKGVKLTTRERKGMRTATGKWATDETLLQRILEQITDKESCRCIELILKFRDLSKDKGTYIDGLQEILEHDGRIRSPVFLHTVATGRASCRLHNVKKQYEKDENGNGHYILLDQFIARDGYVYVKADFKQAEFRMAGCQSKDPVLIQAFKDGRDLHHETAEFIFQLPKGVKETESQRTLAKNGNFGSLYGLEESELYDYLRGKIRNFSLTRGEVGDFHRKFYAKYNVLGRWQKQIIAKTRKLGYVEGYFGRTRKLDPSQGRHFENQTVNTPIQGSAHDLLLVALIQLYHLPNRDFYIVLEQHDAAILEVPEVGLMKNLKRIKSCMENLDLMRWYGRCYGSNSGGFFSGKTVG